MQELTALGMGDCNVLELLDSDDQSSLADCMLGLASTSSHDAASSLLLPVRTHLLHA